VRIAIDARAYGWTGIGRYTRSLLAALARIDSEHQFIVLTGREEMAQVRRALPAGRFAVAAVDTSYYSWREQTIFWRQLLAVEADLFHFTHFNAPLFFRRKYVVTVHDTTRFIFPGQRHQALFKQLAYEKIFQRVVEAAAGVVCVSKSTRQELSSLPLSLPPNVRVIPEAASRIFHLPVSASRRERARLLLGFTEPFLLYVGVWMSHKNLPRILETYARVIEHYPRLKLVMTGRPRRGYVSVDRVARSLGLENDRIIYLGFAPHELLPALYAEATCLLLPSLYEGFGLTALEAAACGTPVVASRVTSLPEVLEDAAEYVNPEFVPGIAAGVLRVLRNPAHRQELIRRGQARAAAFSWEETARQTLAMYEAAV
jgi:glycosyltransferase involved in cell wall biosynthesis